MYYILHNTDYEKVTILKDDANFVHFMRNIAVENGDEELSITHISEAMDYFENYCPNLTFLVEKPKVTPIYTDPRISYLPPTDGLKIDFNDLSNEIIKCEESLTYSLDGFVEAFNNDEISDLGHIAIKTN